MRWCGTVVVVSACAWVSGCTEETIQPEAPGGGGMSAVSTTVSVSSSSSAAGTGGGTATTSSSTGTSMIGAPCDPPCADDEYCDQGLIFQECYFDGQCSPVSPSCISGGDRSDEPACGCDGVVYANACEAALAGVGTGGVCEPPPGMFECGNVFCVSGQAACATDHVFFNAYCPDLPPECVGAGPVDCSCFPPGTTCHGCSMDAEGNFFLDCNSND